MKVVARKGEGPHTTVIEIWLNEQDAKARRDTGNFNEEIHDMVDECLEEHLKGLHRAQRIRMTPKVLTRFSTAAE